MCTAFRGWEVKFEQKRNCSCEGDSRENALMFKQDLSCIRNEVIVGAGCSFSLSGSSKRSLFS